LGGEASRVAGPTQGAAYVKNRPGLDVPYLMGSTPRKYIPVIVAVDDSRRAAQPVIEIKGFRGEDAKEKANAHALLGAG
jgi:type III restriction enzyme